MQSSNLREESAADLHLKLSEKYMAYRDLADRCMISKEAAEKGEKRCFYLKPNTPFLDEPRKQNQYRHEFIRQIGQAPQPEPLTFLADDLQKGYIELVRDRSNPAEVKDELAKFFKRRQYRLQHRRYKMLLRWAHFCVTSEKVDTTNIKFNPAMSKLQFELENCVKRVQRLEGTDHFLTPDRPEQKDGSSYRDGGVRPPLSALRSDDIDVYFRAVTYEERATRGAERFIQRVKWLPLSSRFEVYAASMQYFQECRSKSLTEQTNAVEEIEARGRDLIELKKLREGRRELEQIKASKPISKHEKKIQNTRDQLLSTAKYNYEMPPMIFWNEVDLKIRLAKLSKQFGITGDMDKDSGHTFSFSVITFFPTAFSNQVVKNQFAPYDALPSMLNPKNLGDKQIKKVMRRNQKKYGRTQGGNTLLEKLEIEKHSKEMGIEFLNSVENSLFGQFNAGQIDDFPTVRVKSCTDWIDLVCFKPHLDNDQMHQAAILSGEKNWIDECLANFLEIVNVQDLSNVNLILESIAQIHYDKVKYGQVRTDFLNFDPTDTDTFFSEDQKQFLSIFKGSLKAKADFDKNKKTEEISSTSLHEIPSHLLLATYLLQCLNAREEKTKLLYTLNSFRAIQKRLTLELREMGTRDRVLGDALLVRPKEAKMSEGSGVSEDESTADETGVARIDGANDTGGLTEAAVKEQIDLNKDPLIEINKYKFGKALQNYLHSTCPLVPKFHATFGQAIERQEISKEVDQGQTNTDSRRSESKKFLGRVDKLYKHEGTDLNLVMDDFGAHVFYDAAFSDMRAMEHEILKICSFYINKAEPLLDNDLRNMYPAVDRLRILDEVMHYENKYQEAKLEYVQVLMECYEHTSDILEQQRLIQDVVDEMARRPRLNLSGSHFKDSYTTEIECFKAKAALVKDVVRMIMRDEFKVNTGVREYVEKSYRLLHEQIKGNFKYVEPEEREDEINMRELNQTGEGGMRDAANDKLLDAEFKSGRKLKQSDIVLNDRQAKTREKYAKIQSLNFSDAKEFAKHIGLPYPDLEMMLADHHERDHLVRVSVHENASFVKMTEGYPHYLYKSHKNKFKFHEGAHTIDLLDFYEGLHVMPRVLAAMNKATKDLYAAHRPDNGLLSAALDLQAYRFMQQELENVRAQAALLEQPDGMLHLEDDTIAGNPDYLLYLTKELAASKTNPMKAQNPFIVGKLDLESINKFDFTEYQGYIDPHLKLNAPGKSEQEKKADEAKITKRKFSHFYPVVKGRARDPLNFPSMLFLACNSVEVVRLRHVLLMCLEQAQVLEQVYERQVKAMAKEGRVRFKDPFNFQNFVAGENFVDFIEDGSGDEVSMGCLAVNEFDPKLRSSVNFGDPEAFKAILLPMGLEELRACVQYEVMNLQCLIVGTQTNQILMDNAQRKLCEIKFFEDGFTVANPVFNLHEKLQSRQSMSEQYIRKLPSQERSEINSRLQSSIGECYYNIIKRKLVMKDHVEKVFKAIKQSTTQLKDQKIELLQKQLRIAKLVLCTDYAQDVLARVYCDALKLQTLWETDSLRRRAYLLPRDSIFVEMFPSRSGEHAFAHYNEEAFFESGGLPSRDAMLFYNKAENRIANFWRLPSNKEVVEVDIDMEAFKKANMPQNLNYDLGVPAEKTLPEFIQEDPCPKVEVDDDEEETAKKAKKQDVMFERLLCRLPKLTYSDSRDFDAMQKERGRLVEFTEAFDYSQGASRITQYLSYFKSIGNIYDLEFFTNKLSSSANTMCNVEKMVLSGVPFWEEGDDTLFGDSAEDEGAHEQEELHEAPEATPSNSRPALRGKGDKKKKEKDDDRFEEGGHRPLKNVLATKVAEKVADEKREKMQLIQDLESIKDLFVEYGEIMAKQEMGGSMQRAATFLHELHQIKYYGVLNILYQMQDNYYKDKKGQKEILFLNEAIQHLSHQQDLKVTFDNGFHVNYALTAKERVLIDADIFQQDYDNFFKATQPIIDEEALNPPVFNLITNIYLTDAINLSTFKKSVPFMGVKFSRDYSCLDFMLTNLSKPVRKYLMQNINSNEHTLQQFVLASSKLNEKEYQSNPSVYAQILNDKKSFLRTMIRARQSRRIMMIIKSGKVLPTDVAGYNEVYQEYHSEMMMRINHKLDSLQKTRAAAADRDMANLRRKGQVGEEEMLAAIKLIKLSKDSTVVKSYDQACSEIEVIHQEVQKFLIKTSFDMFERETQALARTFELTNVRLQAFVHPAQQFASTFHQQVDNRNHLDIINKVGPIQKMLTQIKNRCLEIQTLTSGVGVVISSKDLNECLEDCCRSLIKYGEIEMRTRCEHLYNHMVQYENLIYVKDMQLLNLETKLRTAKQEMNKIINTKVFSRGNNLVYELDMTTRQLRLIKDNIFLLEKNLTDKIKLCYQKELDTTKAQLATTRMGLKDYQDSVEQTIRAEVRHHVNNIDGTMKQMAQRYKDLSIPTKKQEKFEEFLQKQPASMRNTVTIDDVVLTRDGQSVQLKGPTDPKLLDELDELKRNEFEARQEILRLQDVIRLNRSMMKLKEVLTKERHQYQIDNLKQQLTSNTTLWEQLAEGEKREKILKQEIERAQQEIATQEKIIERLKDDIKREGMEKQKLLQFRNTKSKRLNELESKAREFEVLSSVNLGKILSLLESKEKKITELQRGEDNLTDFISAMTKLNKQEMEKVRQRAKDETRFKVDAMTKLEGLRQELQMIQGNDQVSVNFWKEQCQSLFEICRNLKDDNERLVSNLGAIADVSSSGARHPLDNFNNNNDLLNYLNSQQQAYNTQPRTGYKQRQAESQSREHYERLAYGMEKSLQDHMLGSGTLSLSGNTRNKQSHSLTVGKKFGAPNHNHLQQMANELRESQQIAQMASAFDGVGAYVDPRLNLPKINLTGQKRPLQQYGPGYLDSSVMLGGGQGPARLLGSQQPSPFGAGKLPGIHGLGGNVRADNVFSTLQAENSLMSNANSSPQPKGPSVDHGGSLDQSTMMTQNVSQVQHSGSRPHVSYDLQNPHYSVDQQVPDGAPGPLGNNVNAPRTHRANELSSRGGVGHNGPSTLNTAAKGPAAALQPKLIEPSSKLTRTLDVQGARGATIKKNLQK